MKDVQSLVRVFLKIHFLSHEVAAAPSCGRKPAESETKKVLSREAAAAIWDAECTVAASRLKTHFITVSVGLRPRLGAAIASRFRKPTMQNARIGLVGYFHGATLHKN